MAMSFFRAAGFISRTIQGRFVLIRNVRLFGNPGRHWLDMRQ